MGEPTKMLTLAEYNSLRSLSVNAYSAATAANKNIDNIKAELTHVSKIYYGTAEPSASLGKDGDLYFQYEEEITETEA